MTFDRIITKQLVAGGKSPALHTTLQLLKLYIIPILEKYSIESQFFSLRVNVLALR